MSSATDPRGGGCPNNKPRASRAGCVRLRVLRVLRLLRVLRVAETPRTRAEKPRARALFFRTRLVFWGALSILRPPRRVFAVFQAYLLGLLAMIKCSICSYQCDN